MTAPDFASMDNAELNEAVAIARGRVRERPGGRWSGIDGNSFDSPAYDAAHADAFLLWFLAQERAADRWWNCVSETVVEQRVDVQYYIRKVTLSRELGAPGMVFMSKGESLARCVTVAVLEAHHGR